ncbi:MAG: serine protease [Patescibacteria group bacterium]
MDVISKVRASLPIVLVADADNNIVSKGSGFVFQNQELVVTCAHVVANKPNSSVYLQFEDNDQFVSASVALIDQDHDIALLRFKPDKNRQPLISSEKSVQEGMSVLFSGYPLSLMSLTTHQGIVSSIIKDPTGMTRYLIDGTVNPGNSGGPLLDVDGKVLGVIDATRRENNDIISKLKFMNTGAISLHGLDLVELYNALANNLQLGVGYAVPAGYIPSYPEPKANTKTKKERKKK